MSALVIVLTCALVAFCAAYAGYYVGYVNGRSAERLRCMRLCGQALDDRFSGSVRRVLNGIQERREWLLSEDEFFGPERSGKDRP